MSLKKLLLGVFILCLIFSLISCSNKDQQASRRLVIYTPHGKDLLNDLIARYKQSNPDVDVQFLDMGSREILERLRAERNRPQADLWWGASHITFQTAAEENLLASYRPTWADKVASESRDSEDRWFGTYETPEVIIYNSTAISPNDAPKDWDEVLDPKWRNQVLIRNPNPSDTMRVIFGAQILRFYNETQKFDEGYNWLRRLDANVREYTADGTLLMEKLARNEGSISLWNMPDLFLYREQKGFPQLAHVVPASGTPVITDGIAIVRGTANEEEAKRFYEFVTTPENLIYTANKYYRYPARTDLDRSQLPAWMQVPFKRMSVDWTLLRRESNNWLRYWDTEIKGRSRS
jgi:iron(III) transport system substrate-binding protein